MSKTPAEKMLIKPGFAVFLAGHTPETQELLEPLPPDVTVVENPAGADVAVMFVQDRTDLDAVLDSHLQDVRDTRAAWIVYLKGGRSNINRDSIWARVQELGWRLNANVSVSEEWSAVRLKPLD